MFIMESPTEKQDWRSSINWKFLLSTGDCHSRHISNLRPQQVEIGDFSGGVAHVILASVRTKNKHGDVGQFGGDVSIHVLSNSGDTTYMGIQPLYFMLFPCC